MAQPGELIGGLAAWFAGARKVVAVEPADAPTLHAAFAAGRPVDAPTGGIAADSLAPRRIGELAFGIASAHVDPQVVLVSAGLGATIVPTLGLRQFNLPGLASIPVTLPINRRELCLLRRKDATESVAAREFIALLKNSLAKKVEHMGTLQAVRA